MAMMVLACWIGGCGSSAKLEEPQIVYHLTDTAEAERCSAIRFVAECAAMGLPHAYGFVWDCDRLYVPAGVDPPWTEPCVDTGSIACCDVNGAPCLTIPGATRCER